ncbi:MAG: hypothetical protein AAFO96_03445 [Bacteroidota bacterium]
MNSKKVKISKGQHSGKIAIITEIQKETIGNDRRVKLSVDGEQIWNGEFA